MRNDIRETLGAHAEVEVVHCSARSRVVTEQDNVEGLAGERSLFHPSRMSPSKNIDAFLNLAEMWPEMRFVLAGSDCGDPRKVAVRLEASSMFYVRLWLEVIEEQRAWLYANGYGFLFLSNTEGFGLPLIDAMHFGTPVFLHRPTSLPEVESEVAHDLNAFDPATMRALIEPAVEPSQATRNASAVYTHVATFGRNDTVIRYLRLHGSWFRRDLGDLRLPEGVYQEGRSRRGTDPGGDLRGSRGDSGTSRG